MLELGSGFLGWDIDILQGYHSWLWFGAFWGQRHRSSEGSRRGNFAAPWKDKEQGRPCELVYCNTKSGSVHTWKVTRKKYGITTASSTELAELGRKQVDEGDESG